MKRTVDEAAAGARRRWVPGRGAREEAARRVASGSFASAALLLATLSLGGCSKEEPPLHPIHAAAPGDEPAPAPKTDETARSSSDLTPQASGSTLGAAKRSAENTVGKLEQRSRDIEKEIEEE